MDRKKEGPTTDQEEHVIDDAHMMNIADNPNAKYNGLCLLISKYANVTINLEFKIP